MADLDKLAATMVVVPLAIAGAATAAVGGAVYGGYQVFDSMQKAEAHDNAVATLEAKKLTNISLEPFKPSGSCQKDTPFSSSFTAKDSITGQFVTGTVCAPTQGSATIKFSY